MELTERRRNILKAIVENYVRTAEPVGSKALASLPDLNCSSATIRNEMAEMTAMGLLEQPHTSAGRIPSALGYRIYVNELMNEHRLSLEETRRINEALKQRVARFDDMLADAGKLVSDLTSYPVYTMSGVQQAKTARRFDFIRVDENTVIAVILLDDENVQNRVMHFPEGIAEETVRKLATVFNATFTGLQPDEIDAALVSAAERTIGDTSGLVAAAASFTIKTLTPETPKRPRLAGTSSILSLPEYQDLEKAQRLMDTLSEGDVLPDMPATVQDENGIRILIGPENAAEELKDSGVVLASYDMGNNMRGIIGVVGPTRMNYAKVAAYLRTVALGMQQMALEGAQTAQLPQLGDGSDHMEKERQT